jgi:hypothetical protein
MRSAQTSSGERGGDSLRVQLPQKTEITVAKVLKDIIGKQVQATDAAGQAQPMSWTFEENEPKQVEILERQAKDNDIALIIQMSTSGAPGSQDANVQLTGRLRLHYQWNNQDWILGRIDNVTFRYSIGTWI